MNNEIINRFKKLQKTLPILDFGKSERPNKRIFVKLLIKGKPKTIHFGLKKPSAFVDHHDPARRKNYLTRSAGIRDGQGKLTKDNILSPNYWSRVILW